MLFFPYTYRSSSALYILTALLPLLTPSHADGPNGEQCGPNDGGAICGLNTCCSAGGFCGTTSAYCDSNNGCQSAYGSCSAPAAPTCSGSSASSGRKVGYYQSVADSGRSCENISPAQINTTGLTHLVFAFAGFDSSSFAITPAQPGDPGLYAPFTALQSPNLQTWISIGGGSFPTATWSAMVSTSQNRAAFISSLKSFMQQHAFQGADLDWEFPNPNGSDAQNLVRLVQEMKTAFAGAFGISATLPADWGSVRGFDAAGMGASLDFFSYMAYDIHGWGVDGGAAQQNVSYPAAVTAIANDMMPIWANQTDPSQINLGIPYYGRGYTLSNPSCNTVGCAASGPSSPGPCLKDSSGVMSLYEIDQAIGQNGASVSLDSTAMQKVATWGQGQWIAYDDADTVALKSQWADSHCLGGLVFWSLDFNSGAGS